MNIDEIKQLVQLLQDTDIVEFQIETDGVKLTIKKGAVQPPAVVAAPVPPVEGPVQPSPPAADEPAEAELDTSDLVTIPAPMVGTFYRAPDPEADPYVREGDVVDVGQPLCIIEAMKLMNEIESEVKGKIIRILVNDGEPVEYGEPLFLIQPES